MYDELRKLSQHFLKLKNSPYRRYFIQNTPLPHRLSFILGQRGVGKTTTLVQHLVDQTSGNIFDPSILYVQADHFLVGNTPLYEIAEQFHLMGGKVLALDEIHKYPNWSQEIKSLYDTFPKLKIIASGSSALRMHEGSHDLSRRAIKYQLLGLSFREFLELATDLKFSPYQLEDVLQNHEEYASKIIDLIESKNHKIIPLFHQYLRCGYYPYYFELLNEDLYLITVEQNTHTTIEADLSAIYPNLTGSSLNKIKQLLIFISKAVPFTPNWNKLKDLVDLGDIRTLKTYFQYLEDAYIIRSVSKGDKKLNLMNAPEKVYLDNPNQIHALSLEAHHTGTIRELFFLNMLTLEHRVILPPKGDFFVDDRYLFEIGGKNKTFEQISNEKNSYLACDSLEIGFRSKIPLWLFGFLY